MHDLARASVLGGLLFAGLLGAVACWQVAPDSANDVGPDGAGADAIVTIEGAIQVDAPGSGDSTSGDGTGGDGGPGSGDAADAAPLVIAPTPSPAIGTGVAFGCYIDATGAVWCWGDNEYGQAGSTPSSAGVAQPQLVTGVSNAVWIALGDYHACAITASQAVYCWGLNGSYQLGHAAATSGDGICPGAVGGQTVPCASTPVLVAGIPQAVAIAAAGTWTCIVAVDGSVQCWGGMQLTSSDAGVPCGVGTQATGGSCYPAPTPVAGVNGATLLAVGDDHACAIVAAGSQTDAGNQVACWGKNNEAQVSPSACPQSVCTTPAVRSDLPTATGILAGNAFTCALASDGSVRCFGDNSFGELGHAPGSSGDLGNPTDLDSGLGVYNATPVPAAATSNVSLVGGGSQVACGLLGTGTTECWGQVTAAGTSTPTAVTGLPAMVALGAYDDALVCGFAAGNGAVWCWTLGSTVAPAQLQPSAGDAGDTGGPG
jgi:hypothetical protein